MLAKLNINIAIGVALIGLITWLFISKSVETKQNYKLEKQLDVITREDSNKAVKIKNLLQYDSLNRKNIETIQKDFLVYRDSFKLYKNNKIFNDRIITISKIQKCLSKKIAYDTLIINKVTYEKQ